jgi:NAD(P)-dependent dehydrogenase (short-subunit alcohol dehydrogenase family)
VIDVNLRGVVHGVQAAYPVMVRQGDGHIVNTASLAGLLPAPGLAPYGATKWAVVGLSLSLRGEGAANACGSAWSARVGWTRRFSTSGTGGSSAGAQRRRHRQPCLDHQDERGSARRTRCAGSRHPAGGRPQPGDHRGAPAGPAPVAADAAVPVAVPAPVCGHGRPLHTGLQVGARPETETRWSQRWRWRWRCRGGRRTWWVSCGTLTPVGGCEDAGSPRG